MIAVDTNILVYAHREESAWHKQAFQRVKNLAESRSPWAIPWPCIHEFLAIVTHPRIYNPPTPYSEALKQVSAWIGSPSLILISEREGYWEELEKTLKEARVQGPQVHDASIVALCKLHGVRELWSADRDFSRFAGLDVSNPMVEQD